MKKLRIIAALIIILLTSVCANALAAAPQRVVSLKPSITDTIYALGLGDTLVGVTKYCEVPKGKPRPEVAADYTRPYTERIIALTPDIVLGSQENSSRRSIESIERAGIAVKLFPFTSLDESLASIEGIAETLGSPDKGRLLSKRVVDELNALKRRFGNRRPLKAVVVWGQRPLIIAGPGTYMDEAIPYIGLKNVAASISVKYPKVGLEQLIAFDPDVIIDLSMDSQAGSNSQRPWTGVGTIKAVREGRVIAMDPGLFRAGPNIPNALEKLAARIYGN